MRLLLSVLLVVAGSSLPVLAKDPTAHQQDEVAACIIGHAAIMVTRGADAESAEQKAAAGCPKITFDDPDLAESWEEFILSVLSDIGQ